MCWRLFNIFRLNLVRGVVRVNCGGTIVRSHEAKGPHEEGFGSHTSTWRPLRRSGPAAWRGGNMGDIDPGMLKHTLFEKYCV